MRFSFGLRHWQIDINIMIIMVIYPASRLRTIWPSHTWNDSDVTSRNISDIGYWVMPLLRLAAGFKLQFISSRVRILSSHSETVKCLLSCGQCSGIGVCYLLDNLWWSGADLGLRRHLGKLWIKTFLKKRRDITSIVLANTKEILLIVCKYLSSRRNV